ncbi:epoxide hydrolase N-terminal domain-containing protein [Streptomyces sp. NPDC001970]
MARTGDRPRPVSGHAARDDEGTRALVGVGLRLAQGQGEAVRPAAVITEIDGLDIHFIHVRSKHENALPLIVTHEGPARSSSS